LSRASLFTGLLVIPAAAAIVPVAPLAAQALAATATSSRWAEAIKAGQAKLTELMAEHAVPGMSIAVLVDGQVVWSEGFGYADLENRVPVTPLTVMRIGSVSKTLTAAALGRLIEQDRLDVDAPVQRYVPWFPEKRWQITTRQLAGHQAGIRHYVGNEPFIRDRYRTVREGLDIFKDDTLLFEPGSRFAYSSYGWNLISAVVEGASGDDFLSYMRKEVFEPLGLRSILAEHTDSIIAYRASFYLRDSDTGLLLNAPYVDNSYKWAGGGFVSNTEDLVRFGWAHLAGGFLDESTVTLLFTPQKTSSGEATVFGMGWILGTDSSERRIIAHGGSSVGGSALLVLYPDQRVVIAVLANVEPSPMNPQFTEQLAAPFMK
jgi:CubicO group peptidase (beta-lactamase class C family)